MSKEVIGILSKKEWKELVRNIEIAFQDEPDNERDDIIKKIKQGLYCGCGLPQQVVIYKWLQ